MSRPAFSPARLWAMMVKEFIQMRRDRLTFAMMVGIPLMQLILFGFAINSDPRHLPTAVLDADHGPEGRAIIAAMEASRYFSVIAAPDSDAEADMMLKTGQVQFVVRIPAGFSRQLQRGDRPALLVEADATDPAATSGAVATLNVLGQNALTPDLTGPLASLAPRAAPFDLRVHRRYNPEASTQYNIVPGLMGVVLTMTMVMMTALAVTRERERGTLETLLVMPLRPAEVMLGKIIPYIAVGYLQIAIILLAARWVFAVPLLGGLGLLTGASILFIAANLAIGYTFSTIARTQMQAMQMGFFYFLPSILLSGFMFPFRGMPVWAQGLGEILPLTHFLRIIRGVMLKGNGIGESAQELLILAATLLVTTLIALRRYRQTLD